MSDPSDKGFIYARHAPAQSIALVTGGAGNTRRQTRDVVLQPGQPADLPADHPVTRKMISVGYLVDTSGAPVLLDADAFAALDADARTAQAATRAARPAKLDSLAEGDDRRMAAIASAWPHVEPEDMTDKSLPKVSRMRELTGFKVTQREVERAGAKLAKTNTTDKTNTTGKPVTDDEGDAS